MTPRIFSPRFCDFPNACYRRRDLILKRGFFILLALLVSVLSAEAKSRRSAKKSRTPSPPAIQKNYSNTPFSTVVVDAGHGGRDDGGIPQNLLLEKQATLDVALRLDKELKKAGFKTVLTRRKDVFIPLDSRAAIANSHPGAVFISIHFDSSPKRTPRGVDVHYATPGEAPLAATILRHLAKTTDGTNRGIKRARFCVLRKTRSRAVLAECGFLTNRTDADMVRKASYRQKLAKALCTGIVEYRNTLR